MRTAPKAPYLVEVLEAMSRYPTYRHIIAVNPSESMARALIYQHAQSLGMQLLTAGAGSGNDLRHGIEFLKASGKRILMASPQLLCVGWNMEVEDAVISSVYALQPEVCIQLAGRVRNTMFPPVLVLLGAPKFYTRKPPTTFRGRVRAFLAQLFIE